MYLQENTLFDIELRVKVTENIAQYPLHHVTYAHIKYELNTSNGLGGDEFFKKIHYLAFGLDPKVAQILLSSLHII